MIGKTITHYEIVEKLGEGGMGVVYKARDTTLDRFAAIKFLPTQLSRDEEAAKRFIREAKAASALEHPNICTIYEIDETSDGHLFLVMPYYDGETLQERLEKEHLDIGEAMDIAMQVASGMAKAHEKGIIHRDIKPGNVMLTDNGRHAILMDFGLAKKLDATRLTRTGMTLGTVAYMSPEQALGKETDGRTDVWSLGVMLYEMLSGVLPFQGNVEPALVYSIINEEPELLSNHVKNVPLQVEEILEKALAKNVDRRCSGMTELFEALEETKDRLTLGIKKRRFIGLRRSRRKRRIVCCAAIVFFLAAAIITARYIHEKNMALDSIAVLPLENLSKDPDQEYLADGLTGDLITGLSRVSGLEKVISRVLMMQYKGLNKPVREIARDLDVKVLVAGTVQPAGSRVKLGVELIHAGTGKNLWSDTFDRPLGDIHILINEITRMVAEQIDVRLTPDETAQLASGNTVDPEAYEAYLRARAFVEKWSDEGFIKSFDYLRKAIEKDPAYAPAYAELVVAYADAHRFGHLSYEEAYPEARQAVVKAMELDDEIVESHVALGMFRFVFEWDWKGADDAFRQAFSIDPRNARAQRQYGNFLVHMGQKDESIAMFKHARELAPLSIYINQNLGWAYYHARRYDEALAQLEKTLALLEQFPDPLKGRQLNRQLLWCYIVKGMHDEAFEKLEELGDWVGPEAYDRIWAYVALGRREEISEMIETLLKKSDRSDAYYRSSGIHPWSLAILGERDRAIHLLEVMYEQHRFSVVFIGISPEYDNIRPDPRFQELLDRMDLPWHR